MTRAVAIFQRFEGREKEDAILTAYPLRERERLQQ